MLTKKQIENIIAVDATVHRTMYEANQRYEGNFPRPLKPIPSDKKGEDNTSVNLSKVIVDTAVHFLLGNPVDIEVEGDEESPEDEYVRAFWEQNDKDQFLFDLATAGAVNGHVFVRVHAPYDEYEYPVLEALDPMNVSVYRNPANYREVLAYVITCTSHNPLYDGRNSDTLQFQEVIEKTDRGTWLITKQVCETGGRNTQVMEPVEWSLPYPPILDSKNLPSLSCYWGIPDLTADVIRTNQSLNFAVSNTNRIVRTQGHAKTFITGVDEQALLEVDDFGNSRPSVDMNPDSVTVLESESADIKQIAPNADIDSHIDYIKELKDQFFDVAGVPSIALGKVNLAANLSGIALKIAYTSLINKTKSKQRLYGKLIQNVSKMALLLGGYDYNKTITVRWQGVIPESDLERLQVAVIKKNLGISTATILTELGYDSQIEIDKSMKEKVNPDF